MFVVMSSIEENQKICSILLTTWSVSIYGYSSNYYRTYVNLGHINFNSVYKSMRKYYRNIIFSNNM